MRPEQFESWLTVDARGLYCRPGGFHIDPHAGAKRAVITHGHSDHARPGHDHVLATRETLAVMKTRLGAAAPRSTQEAAYGEAVRIGDVTVTLLPAGHVLGSAQVLIEWKGVCAVVSGDYKRSGDPTCAGFELVPCDLFVTEATFALPVFQHGDVKAEVGKLLKSRAQFPDRAHVVGVYGLGKCQRLIALLREAGYDRPIYLHGALIECCALYESFGVRLGELRPATGTPREEMKGEIVLAPPSAIADRWSRRLPDPVTAFASGWMRVRARARRQGVELPLVISDHADWRELTETIAETGAREVWVTHGREDALLHHIEMTGRRGRALALIGREDEDQ
ncbi:ligase-associated DNA damage response exonuclease [Methyloceanibacter sp.]|jgi:putative mRNA 3-end processing factor|uniref:ligase-associated DNA damage response exonuclease n=1 Tax=Methyloceanibacter sp. TaxID=1965321 RepID=UPI00351B6545